MQPYTTIYSTNDSSEISILKNLFDQEGIDYNVLGEVTDASAGIAGSGMSGIRLQVREDERERAKEILLESGFLGHRKPGGSSRNRKSKIGKGVIIFLAVLVVIIVAFLIWWFMNVE